jgi:hypothetical protein
MHQTLHETIHEPIHQTIHQTIRRIAHQTTSQNVIILPASLPISRPDSQRHAIVLVSVPGKPRFQAPENRRSRLFPAQNRPGATAISHSIRVNPSNSHDHGNAPRGKTNFMTFAVLHLVSSPCVNRGQTRGILSRLLQSVVPVPSCRARIPAKYRRVGSDKSPSLWKVVQ